MVEEPLISIWDVLFLSLESIDNLNKKDSHIKKALTFWIQ